MVKFLNGNLVFLVIILFGSLLRVYNLTFDDLWYDEIISFWVSSPQHSLLESFTIHNRIEINTFTYHFLLKNIFNIFGYDYNFARYISAFFGIWSIVLSYKLSEILKIKYLRNFLAFLIAFNIFLISYSQEGRVYSILFFFSFLSFIYFLKISSHRCDKKDLFQFAVYILTAILFHPFALIILFSFTLYLILKYIFYKEVSKKINLVIFLVYIFSLIFYCFFFLSIEISHSRHFWISNPDIKFFSNFFFSNFFGSRLMGLIFLISLISLIIKEKKFIVELNIVSVFLISILLIYFLPILFGYIYKPVLVSRYIIFVLIPIFIIISYFILRIKNNRIKKFLYVLLIISTIGNHFTEQTFKQFAMDRIPSKPEYKNAVTFMKNSNINDYFIKVENMKSDKDTIHAINNYIDILNDSSYRLKNLNFENLEMKNIFWQFCPQDINKKNYLFDIKKDYEVMKEKNFNNINLKLIKLL